jgi:hypothetical protein
MGRLWSRVVAKPFFCFVCFPFLSNSTGLLATLSLFLGQANGQVYALQPFLVGEYDFFNASIWRSDAPYLGVVRNRLALDSKTV